MIWLALAAACTAPDTDSTPISDERPWTRTLPSLAEDIGGRRDLTPHRTIVHLHSAWSHDACDGEPLVDGAPDATCVDALREALCDTAVDVAFLTDHPAHAATAPFEALFHPHEGDAWVEGADGLASQIACPSGHTVTWRAGIEDELMPVGLNRHVADTPEENDAWYNRDDPDAIRAEVAAGGAVFIAHTEQRDDAALAVQQDAGLTGVELFNLHAAFDPDLRGDFLGLDPWGWTKDIAPFTSPEGDAEPDLFVLAVLTRQDPSLAHWDALLARGAAVGVAGTDAHQNVLPLALRDGERGDSYRRMLRWFGNVVWTRPGETVEDALRAGRAYVAFDVLGTPAGVDVHLDTADGVVELGGEGRSGDLVVGCPTLSPASPRGPDAPIVETHVFHDGVEVSDACGTIAAGPGVWRVEHRIVPRHLRPFLGSAATYADRAWPWVYTNAIRVR